MYATGNPRTKKELKHRTAIVPPGGGPANRPVGVFSPGPFPAPTEGKVTIEGPHYPAAHTWYATATVRDGFIVPGSVR